MGQPHSWFPTVGASVGAFERPRSDPISLWRPERGPVRDQAEAEALAHSEWRRRVGRVLKCAL
jgi:hypothetical protein